MRVVRFWNGDRYDIGLSVESDTEKHVLVIPMRSRRIRVRRLPNDADLSFTYLDYDGPKLRRALKRFFSAGERFGISDEAQHLITTALKMEKAQKEAA